LFLYHCLSLLTGHVAVLPYAGGHPGVIQWGYQVDQLSTVNVPSVKCGSQFVEDVNPTISGKVELP